MFLIMMIRLKKAPGMFFPANQLVPAIFISVVFLVVSMVLASKHTEGWAPLAAAQAPPKAFGVYLFQTHWLSVEIASMLLLVGPLIYYITEQ